jgi:hypothetical protein
MHVVSQVPLDETPGVLLYLRIARIDRHAEVVGDSPELT